MKQVDLGAVKQQLKSFLGSKLKSLDPDAIGAALGTIQWRTLPAGIIDDEAIVQFLEIDSLPLTSALVVVIDASFIKRVGAFVTSVAEFATFQKWHLDEFAEFVFSGSDVIVWAPADKRVWVVHHERVYATMLFGV